MDFDFLATRGLTGARTAGGLEGDFSGDEERIRALRRRVGGGLTTQPCCFARSRQEQGTRFGAQTDVHRLIRV
jgi:hypothetical protein